MEEGGEGEEEGSSVLSTIDSYDWPRQCLVTRRATARTTRKTSPRTPEVSEITTAMWTMMNQRHSVTCNEAPH